MEKLLNIKITHFSEHFEITNKPPYYIVIQYRNDYFYFQNKRESQRWLSKFKKESTSLYKELGMYLSKIYTYQIQLVTIIDFNKYEKSILDLSYYNVRYSKLLKTDLLGKINIGSEVDKLYETIFFYLQEYKTITQKNARFYSVHADLNYTLKSIIRLRKDLDILFESKSGIKKVTKSTPDFYYRVLKIA